MTVERASVSGNPAVAAAGSPILRSREICLSVALSATRR